MCSLNPWDKLEPYLPEAYQRQYLASLLEADDSELSSTVQSVRYTDDMYEEFLHLRLREQWGHPIVQEVASGGMGSRTSLSAVQPNRYLPSRASLQVSFFGEPYRQPIERDSDSNETLNSPHSQDPILAPRERAYITLLAYGLYSSVAHMSEYKPYPWMIHDELNNHFTDHEETLRCFDRQLQSKGLRSPHWGLHTSRHSSLRGAPPKGTTKIEIGLAPLEIKAFTRDTVLKTDVRRPYTGPLSLVVGSPGAPRSPVWTGTRTEGWYLRKKKWEQEQSQVEFADSSPAETNQLAQYSDL